MKTVAYPGLESGATEFRGRWEPLRYLNLFRLVLAGVFLVAGPGLSLGGDSATLFFGAAFAYLTAVLILGFPDAARHLGMERLVTVQVLVDVTLLTVIMWASGGYRSGMPILIMIVLAGSGLVGQGRMVLFYAAYATVAVLFENLLRFLSGRDVVDFFTVGVTCIGFFTIAQVARLLALRAIANETLARQRGADLAAQLRLNQQIIQDMQDGVLVVEPGGVVRHFNPQANALLGGTLREGGALASCAPALAGPLGAGEDGEPGAHSALRFRAEGSGKLLLARMLRAGDSDATLVYLEDFDLIHDQIQQVKLAALGRLTASIAHEIRNPLAAVSHAAELLSDEKRGDMQARLIRIIGTNAQRIDRLVGDVLALGRRDEALPEVLPLKQFVDEFLDEFALTDPVRRALVDVAIASDLTLLMDRTHLRQILWNLLANAQRHGSGAPGSIRIAAGLRDDGRIAVDVTDDGPGIAEALRNQVFEPFFTTHSKGTGLGLYIARELADANGAVLELGQAEAGRLPGAHFRLTARSRS